MADENAMMTDAPKAENTAAQGGADQQQNASAAPTQGAGVDSTKAAAPAPGSTQTPVTAAGTARFQVTATLKGHERSISGIKFSPDGKYLATACKYYISGL